jgi:hypothetical protein
MATKKSKSESKSSERSSNWELDWTMNPCDREKIGEGRGGECGGGVWWWWVGEGRRRSYVDGAAGQGIPLLAQLVSKICWDSMNLLGGQGQGGKSVHCTAAVMCWAVRACMHLFLCTFFFS